MEFSKISKSAKKKVGGRWNVDLDFILTFYDCYIRERSLRKVAASLDMRLYTLVRLVERHPELRQAIETADHFRTKNVLKNYILRNLSAEARAVWDKLQTKNTLEEVELLFKKRSVKLRQQLFCHALLHTGYNTSKALQMVGVSYRKLMEWKNDLEFLQLLEEIQFQKKNFFESALIGLVAEGHPNAVMFVNRTINADRGYTEKLEITNTDHPNVNVNFDIADLDLDLETQKKILAAIEKKKAEQEQEQEKALTPVRK